VVDALEQEGGISRAS